MKVIFLLNRYSPLIDSTIGLSSEYSVQREEDTPLTLTSSDVWHDQSTRQCLPSCDCPESENHAYGTQSCDIQFHVLMCTSTHTLSMTGEHALISSPLDTYTVGAFLSEGRPGQFPKWRGDSTLTPFLLSATAILIARTLALYEFKPWIICIMIAIALEVIVRGIVRPPAARRRGTDWRRRDVPDSRDDYVPPRSLSDPM